MNHVKEFLQGLRKLPNVVQLWLLVLGVSNMMIPLFFINRVEAQVMFGATVLSFVIGVIMYRRQGMTRLMGLMHIPWIIPAYYLIKNSSNIHFNNVYGIWMGVALSLTCISLIFDTIDIIRYISGNRKSQI